jgi:hypothetical protein
VAAVGDGYIGVYTFDNLWVRGQAQVITEDNVVVLGELELDEGLLSVTNISANTIALENNSEMNHPTSSLTNEYHIVIATNQFSIDETSKIDLSGKGYLGGWSGDNDSLLGVTLGNTITGGSDIYSGGSYGGSGFAPDGSISNELYGDYTNPGESGSGGGGDEAGNHKGGSGGGLLKLFANTLTLNGGIYVNGVGSLGGGGSGGGIFIDCDLLTGTGMISADGGDSTYGGGGGGGRVAVYCGDILEFDTNNITVYEGYGYNDGNGQQGTIYINQANECIADFDGDGDVDGADLAAYILDSKEILLETFSAQFGKANCLNN